MLSGVKFLAKFYPDIPQGFQGIIGGPSSSPTRSASPDHDHDDEVLIVSEEQLSQKLRERGLDRYRKTRQLNKKLSVTFQVILLTCFVFITALKTL